VDPAELNQDDWQYRQMVEAITDYAIFRLDRDGRVASWNPGAQRFKGYQASEILGQHFSRFYTPEDLAADLPKRALESAARDGRFENEGWRLRKDGSRFWAHVIIDPIFSPAGVLEGYAKVTRDLTERMEATEALRRSHEQFQILVDGVTDYAIYMLDPKGHVTNWNSGAERIKGYSRAEIIGKHVSTFYTDEEREAGAPQQALAAARREGRYEKEGWRVRKDGSRFWAHVVVDAVRNAEGEIIGFAKVTRDITERTEAQRDLELAREALFQSQKLEAIGHLTGGIAHDFNNLLAAVLGSLELVKKRLDFDPRISPLIDNAVMGAQRGAALTQRMLAFARKQELKLEPVDVSSLVGGMIDFVARTIGSDIDIETDLPSGLPRVLSDPNQLDAAVLNLAVNARDAMPGGGRLRISARREPDGGHVRLSLSDTGEGMDAETVAKAADPFFTTKGVGKGTGLGLSMVHGLMIQCGGHLQIRSEPGRGTTVDLLMPVAPDVEEPVPVTADFNPAGWSRNLSGLRVLAVDDDPLVLTNTAALLEDLGCQVLVAASGSQALDLLTSDLLPDLMITDQAMPNMSGVELGLAVRDLTLDLPIILATGFAELPAINPTQYRLQKPFSQAELEQAILDVIRLPRSLPA
jgi:PAS domain S-box-containing protein